jgi:peptidoglycan/LPS O-acetylase OafA/YrhL
MRQLALWVGVILVATAIDLAVRFGMPFDLQLVVRVEAVLFLATSLVLSALYRRQPRATGWRRKLQAVLVASFALAGVRSAIWAAGQPVYRANLAVLALAAVATVVLLVRRRARRRATAPDPDS